MTRVFLRWLLVEYKEEKMRKNILLFVLLAAISCNGPTKPQTPILQLTLDDASCTDVYLKLAVSANISERTVMLKRDNVELWTRSIDASETLVTDTSLLPGHTYTYTARLLSPPPFWIDGNSTSQVQVRTMDSTSHNFQFQTFTLGDGTGTSVLYDVQILSDTFAVAVGNIRVNDTTYGATVWDGMQWNLMIVPAHDYASTTLYPSIVKTVWVFNSQCVYFATDANMLKWDGQSWSEKAFFMTGIPFTGQVNKMWASSEDDIYCVGNSGSIYHYTGSGTWTKVESGTITVINDVYGINNIMTENREVYCAVTDFFQPKDRKILRITNTTTVDSIPWTTQRDVLSIWSWNGLLLYASGNGLFENHSGEWKKIEFGVYTNHVRGSAVNNVIAVGDFGLIANFNGSTWKIFYPEPNADYSSVAVTDNFMIAVGSKGVNAIAVIGKR
jgi:hypothetical protein